MAVEDKGQSLGLALRVEPACDASVVCAILLEVLRTWWESRDSYKLLLDMDQSDGQVIYHYLLPALNITLHDIPHDLCLLGVQRLIRVWRGGHEALRRLLGAEAFRLGPT